MSNEEQKGLYGKYNITYADGTPVDPTGLYFVLRYDTDPNAMVAICAYMQSIVNDPTKEALAYDLGTSILKAVAKMAENGRLSGEPREVKPTETT